MKSEYEFKASEEQTDLVEGTGRIICWKGSQQIAVVDFKETPFVIEPHVQWMDCSMRDKYLSFKWAINGWKKTVFLIVSKENIEFYEQWVKRGLLRKVGALTIPQAKEEIHMYQKVEHE